jgi:hypothetical protein
VQTVKRSTQRHLSLAFLIAVGVVLIVLGFQGWVVDNFLAAQYLGYFLVGLAALGLFGVNVWRGGPLDPKLDEPNRDFVALDDLPARKSRDL